MIRATAADEAIFAEELRELASHSRVTIERRIAADELKAVVLCLRFLEFDLQTVSRRSDFPLDLLIKLRDQARLS